ncbi:Uncharacterized protein Fot_42030 [Forsythia ovata]|uniref:Uncharacterized protein n=1 Tax=Forsythia ovata TaxID=205694 RepID=A0ABD1RLT5_9LAMI
MKKKTKIKLQYPSILNNAKQKPEVKTQKTEFELPPEKLHDQTRGVSLSLSSFHPLQSVKFLDQTLPNFPILIPLLLSQIHSEITNLTLSTLFYGTTAGNYCRSKLLWTAEKNVSDCTVKDGKEERN